MSPWFAIPSILAGLILAFSLWRVFAPGRRFDVDERGIHERGRGGGLIPWEAIEGAYPPSADDAEGLRVRLRLTTRLARRFAKRRGSSHPTVGESVEVRLDLAGSDVSAVDLLQQILSRRGADAGSG